jgi:molecular chaperone HtpG
MADLQLAAERSAVPATSLDAFNKVNLQGIKEAISQLLRLIGSTGLFQEYTIHDVTHVNRMLELVDDLIPVATKSAMTPADWLLIVLSIYFHDMGLLVSKAEFDARSQSDFEEYCLANFFVGDDGAEYKSRAKAITDSDSFLYQEFVRANHAERIGAWIRGHPGPHLGVAAEAVSTIEELLGGLSTVFREDLALVCESHHRNDLDDRDKYPVRQPYGNSAAEVGNVQYAAIMLRTVDLLHITADRTPSIAFRFINPQNPVSQYEWAKQRSVRSVTPQLGKDDEGNLSKTADQDTIEVFARFGDADGFFGLMAYLRYARDQLQQSFEWARASQMQQAVPHSFPWRKLDDTHITASGFLPKRLAFTLDQGRILELLTGHTLYNDSRVVVRELVQNALDAVRLQTLLTKRADTDGKVEVEWFDERRELVVRDNGTGMAQAIIENNLLKAGASRYQEESFVERHPDFSPISKFGIGVLSAFMVASEVEIVTCAPEEDMATRLKLRSVHDRYLVSLLDKVTDPDAARLAPHGTEFRLRIRETAPFPDVLEQVRRWVVVPRCTVTCEVNGGGPTPVGFGSCADALEMTLRAQGVELHDGADEPSNGAIRVCCAAAGNVETAFAVRWSSAFNEWTIVLAEQGALGSTRLSDELLVSIGACVEGIRVEFGSPGFTDPYVVAVSNATGHRAPKTNVARSGLEDTAARNQMMRHVYDAYIGHVATELAELATSRGFSSTWAAQEAEYMLSPFVVGSSRGGQPRHMDPLALRDALSAKPLVIVEDADGRRLVSGDALGKETRFWTVDSEFIRAGESLLREVPNDSSLAELGKAIGTDTVSLPEGTTLVGFKAYSSIWRFLLSGREVRKIIIGRAQRRLDLGWDVVGEHLCWISLTEDSVFGRGDPAVLVAVEDPEVEGRNGEVAVRSHGRLFLFADSAIAQYARETVEGWSETVGGRNLAHALTQCITTYLGLFRPPDDVPRFVENVLRRGLEQRFEPAADLEGLDMERLASALQATPLRVFDTSAWRRQETD